MIYNYFTWIGTVYLMVLTYQDYKNNRIVDDRKNAFMMGIAISLTSHVKTTLIYKLALVLFLSFAYKFLQKLSAFGEADKSTFLWVFLAYGMINPTLILFFMGTLALTTMLYMGLKKLLEFLLKVKSRPIQYYGIILTNFVLINFLFKLY